MRRWRLPEKVRTRLDLIVVAIPPLRQHLYHKHKNEGQTLSRLALIREWILFGWVRNGSLLRSELPFLAEAKPNHHSLN